MTSLSLRRDAQIPNSPGTDAPASIVERILRFAGARHLNACVVLLAVALACFLPGLASLQPMDRDEPRFAQATKQMLETGDFVDIRFQDEARHKKPVGIYWLQAASVAAGEAIGIPEARTTIALYRLPSFLGALAAVLLTYWAALAFAGRREAFLAALFMATSVILMVEARLAKTDAVLLACSVAVMGGLARAYFGRGGGNLPAGTLALFWGAAALGILVKGPMVPLFAGLCALVLSVRARDARWLGSLRPGLGLAATLLLVAPWFLAIAWKSGGAFFAASAGQDLLGKVGTAQTQHWAPPGTYLLAFFGTFWPAAILTAIAVPFAYANRRVDEVAFALAWIVPSWLVFEAVPTKLPHYVMPLYPALAILTAMAISAGFVGPWRPLARASTVLLPLVPAALAVGLPIVAIVLGDLPSFGAVPFLLAALAASLLAWRSFLRGKAERAAVLMVPAAMALSVGVFGFAQRDLLALRLSPLLAQQASAVAGCPDKAVATLGYREPSLVFLVGTDLEMLEAGAEAARFLAGGPCRVAFVERRFESAFRTALAAAGGADPVLTTRVSGFNINGGRRLDIGVYASPP